jgi:putative salt-induced outer membrane protein YdiY
LIADPSPASAPPRVIDTARRRITRVRRAAVRLLTVVSTLVVAASWSASAAAQELTDVAADLVAAEQALFASMHARDRDGLERLLTPGFVLRGLPDVSRSAWIENAVSLCWGDRFDLGDPVVRAESDSAVVSFALTFFQDPSTCQPATLRSLITDVWVRRDGRWQLAIRHASPVAAGVKGQFAAVPQPAPTLQLGSELSFVATGGNSSTSTLGLNGNLDHRVRDSTTTARIAFVSSRADSMENARSLSLEARHGRTLRPRLEVMARGGYLRDRFAGLEHRTTIDAGMTFTVSRLPRALTLDAALGGVFEQRLDAPDRQFISAVGGLTYDWHLAPGTDAHVRSAATANLQSGRDWRLVSDASVQTSLTKVLAAKFAYTHRYAHDPVPGFRRTDTQATASLVVRYARRPAPAASRH